MCLPGLQDTREPPISNCIWVRYFSLPLLSTFGRCYTLLKAWLVHVDVFPTGCKRKEKQMSIAPYLFSLNQYLRYL